MFRVLPAELGSRTRAEHGQRVVSRVGHPDGRGCRPPGLVMASRDEAEAAGRLAYVDNACTLDDDSMGDMTWEIGDTGFRMGLSSRVPKVIARHLPTYLDDLLCPHDLTPDDVGFWAIHPGGRAIVDKAQQVLNLPDRDIAHSLDVLRDHGNMSSPTILFVLKRIMEERAAAAAGDGVPPDAPAHGVAMAFGPGLTIEGALFRWC